MAKSAEESTSEAARARRTPPGEPSDEELMRRFRDQNDEDAFETIVHRYERELYGYLYRYLHRQDLAQEAFQATFVRVHEKRHLFQEGRRFRTWLYSVATNIAIDLLRKRRRHAASSLDVTRTEDGGHAGRLIDLLESQTPEPLAQLEDEERRQRAHRAIERLPEHLKSVVVLVFFQGLKYREVAEILDIPLGTVKSRMHAALARLHAAFTEQEPPEGADNHGS